jgi:hypothetical protein
MPSTWRRNPKNDVLWFDQKTPTVRSGRAIASAMSSLWTSSSTTSPAENLVYGGSL